MRTVCFAVEKILYVIIAVIGVPVNLVAIVILTRGKCGLSFCTTRYLVAMAAEDLLLIITEVVLYQLNYHYFPVCFLNVTSVCTVLRVLSRIAVNCSVWFSVTSTFDRFVGICCQKLKTKYCTGRTAAVVLAPSSVLFCLKNGPLYFTYREIINNVPWFCYPKPSYFTQPAWVAYDWLDIVLTPFLPFGVILLLNALTIRHILVPVGFILLWLTNAAEFIYYHITGIGTQGNDWEIIFAYAGYLLRNFSCCTNTFIYAATQSRFREQVKSAVKYPFVSVLRFINRVS
ncbi:probable G-protein coupled receptor 139 [Mobula hypostoma]|uniref:probable G-protein coupled receptor 139 n=1 Tax=Mobula hypostoma TaxID=723540 RepID=UPI002FC33643